VCQNGSMARGWESKDVASQVEAKRLAGEVQAKGPESREAAQRERERLGLTLARTRVLQDLERATNPFHRQSLEAALAHLDRKIQELV